MKTTEGKTGAATEASISARMGAGSWIVLVVLVCLLAVTFAIVYFAWTFGKDADVPASGYVAMAFGVVVSLAVGFGLMALIFYSSRKGYDEAPVLISNENDTGKSRPHPETK